LHLQSSSLIVFHSIEIFPFDTGTPMVIEASLAFVCIPASKASVGHVFSVW
jgi:hypothetical protein